MRPLPVLDPLPPSPDVYQDSQDNFLTLFGDLFNQHDSLLSDMAGQQQAYSDGLDPFSSTIDAVDTALNDLISAFDALSTDILEVDLSLVISESQSLDDSLDNNLNSWAPDFGAAGQFFLQIFVDFYNFILVPLFDLIIAAISWLINAVASLIQQVFGIGETNPPLFQG